MRIAILLISLFVIAPASAKEYVSFFGKAVSQRYIPGIEQICPEGRMCPDVIYVWTIRVDKIVSGKLTSKTVRAAMIQHTEYVNAHKRQALFVLSRIESEKKRTLVGTEYWIEEYVPARTLYCLPTANDAYGIKDNELIGRFSDTNCYVRHSNH
jgi:hypothetical protein